MINFSNLCKKWRIFKFQQKLMIFSLGFFNIWPKLMIFQVISKIKIFQVWPKINDFFKFLAKMMIFQNLVKIYGFLNFHFLCHVSLLERLMQRNWNFCIFSLGFKRPQLPATQPSYLSYLIDNNRVSSVVTSVDTIQHDASVVQCWRWCRHWTTLDFS